MVRSLQELFPLFRRMTICGSECNQFVHRFEHVEIFLIGNMFAWKEGR
jgi:hypothetical protein